jgi:hypothetical protein
MDTPGYPSSPARRILLPRRRLAQLLGLVLIAGLVGGAVLFLRESTMTCNAQDADQNTAPRRELFQGWGKPDVALVLTGQMFGYLQPCGCSEPQYGGLARRYNFFQTLKKRGWPLVALDLGDVAQKSGPQAMIKYETAMEALGPKGLGYTAVGVGLHEMDMPLIDALAHYALNNPSPRVAIANLIDPQGQFKDMVRPWELSAAPGAPAVGAVALVGPSVAAKVKDPMLKFARDNGEVLKKAISALATKKAALIVLLYQGNLKEARACAEFWARIQKEDSLLPSIDVVQCLTDEETPPSVPERVGNSLLVTVGHKGRYLGVVGAFSTGQAARPWELRYQLVAIGPEYQSAKGAAPNPIQVLMQEYTEKLKAGDYLARFARTPHRTQLDLTKARYVGSERCGDCHDKPGDSSYKVWQNSKHANAYQKLVAKGDPPGRQFDGECIACHVVGYTHPTGFYDKVNGPKRDALLKNVGCESCHGPGSEHANNPNNPALYPLINPWKAKPGESPAAAKNRRLRIDSFCQSCHDIDNDVHWNFEQAWPKIEHNKK